MKNLVIFTVMLFLMACNPTESTGGTDFPDSTYQQQEIEYTVEATLIFSVAGAYTLYDVETGGVILSHYRSDDTETFGDTLYVALPDSVSTYLFDEAGEVKTTAENTFKDGAAYYFTETGWRERGLIIVNPQG